MASIISGEEKGDLRYKEPGEKNSKLCDATQVTGMCDVEVYLPSLAKEGVGSCRFGAGGTQGAWTTIQNAAISTFAVSKRKCTNVLRFLLT